MDYIQYENWLAHSKGPWKNHKYTAKVGGEYVYGNRPRGRKRVEATSGGGVKKGEKVETSGPVGNREEARLNVNVAPRDPRHRYRILFGKGKQYAAAFRKHILSAVRGKK